MIPIPYEHFRANRSFICDAMRRHGGGFCEGLALALSRADDNNSRRIYETWPHYWQDFGPGGRFFHTTP